MMDIRRAAALLLALVLIAALTVGCGKSRVTPPRIHPLPVQKAKATAAGTTATRQRRAFWRRRSAACGSE